MNNIWRIKIANPIWGGHYVEYFSSCHTDILSMALTKAQFKFNRFQKNKGYEILQKLKLKDICTIQVFRCGSC